MLVGLYIFVDDEFDDPIYSDPEPDELEDGIWEWVCEIVSDCFEGELDAEGYKLKGELLLGWRHLSRTGITFICVVDDLVKPQSVEAYLKNLSRRYLDEVEEPRHPEKGGVEDVVIDVIPSWEEDED